MEAAACDYEKLNELVGQKDAAQAELDALYERWEQLSEEAEGLNSGPCTGTMSTGAAEEDRPG